MKCGCDFASKRAPRSSMLNSLMRKKKQLEERAAFAPKRDLLGLTVSWRYFKVF